MIESYDSMPVRYKAYFIDNQLLVETIEPHVYMRSGYHGSEPSKLKAVESLRAEMMQKFLGDMATIQWQAQRYIE